jgi:hypothetical protein
VLGSFLVGALAAVALTTALLLTRRSLRQTLLALALLALLGLLAGLPELVGTNLCAFGAIATRNCLTPQAPLALAALGLGMGLPLVTASVLCLYDAIQRRWWGWVGLLAGLNAIGWGTALWASQVDPAGMILVGSDLANPPTVFAPFGDALLLYDLTGAVLLGALLFYGLRALPVAPPPVPPPAPSAPEASPDPQA